MPGEKGERGNPGIGSQGQRGLPGPPGMIFYTHHFRFLMKYVCIPRSDNNYFMMWLFHINSYDLIPFTFRGESLLSFLHLFWVILFCTIHIIWIQGASSCWYLSMHVCFSPKGLAVQLPIQNLLIYETHSDHHYQIFNNINCYFHVIRRGTVKYLSLINEHLLKNDDSSSNEWSLMQQLELVFPKNREWLFSPGCLDRLAQKCANLSFKHVVTVGIKTTSRAWKRGW